MKQLGLVPLGETVINLDCMRCAYLLLRRNGDETHLLKTSACDIHPVPVGEEMVGFDEWLVCSDQLAAELNEKFAS